MPLCLLLAFKLQFGVGGLWAGLAVAASVQAIAITLMVLKLDWQAETQRAAANVHNESKALNQESESISDS